MSSTEYARIVLDRFEAVGLATDALIAEAGGPSDSTMTNYRKAARGEIELAKPRTNVFAGIDKAAKWEPGSARKLWTDGTAPVPIAGVFEPDDELRRIMKVVAAFLKTHPDKADWLHAAILNLVLSPPI